MFLLKFDCVPRVDDALVPAHAAGGAEALAAVGAGEGPLVRVRAVVHPQDVQRVEPLAARLALELALVRVVHEVPPVLREDMERLPANFARLPRRRVVDRLVYHQTAFELELLIAYGTRVRFARGVHV